MARELYRPQFHFTPARNWMNDPNGLVHHEGEYHMFFQYNPHGPVWGNISWGHAISRDLVHWTELPIAIPFDDTATVLSGSVVIDQENTSGFGTTEHPPMVAIYSSAELPRLAQSQALAYSLDRGRTWTRYAGNPVLDNPDPDFRDPKVFWYAPTRRWIMPVALSSQRKIQFYSSPNLKDWTFQGEFGPEGAIAGIYEVPNLIPLELRRNGTTETKWLLIVNINPGARAGGSGAQFFLGDFDGRRFEAENVEPYAPPSGDVLAGFEGSSPAFEITRPFINLRVGGDAPPQGAGLPGEAAVNLLVGGDVVRTATGFADAWLDWTSWDVGDLVGRTAQIQIVDGAATGHVRVDRIAQADAAATASNERARWVDWGRDFYAAITFENVPNDRRLLVGWMNNWEYAERIPTSPWRGTQSEPRELSLREIDGRVELIQQPAKELRKLRERPAYVVRDRMVTGTTDLLGPGSRGRALDIVATFESQTADRFGLKVLVGAGEETVIGYDARSQAVFVDRTRSGDVSFHPQFAGVSRAPLRLPPGGRLRLRVLVDHASVEVFADRGQRVITDQVFPGAASEGVQLFAEGGSAGVRALRMWRMESIWSPDA
jgi:sucrose-6-phosphate hydrolase SacC (GH32 family)